MRICACHAWSVHVSYVCACVRTFVAEQWAEFECDSRSISQDYRRSYCTSHLGGLTWESVQIGQWTRRGSSPRIGRSEDPQNDTHVQLRVLYCFQIPDIQTSVKHSYKCKIAYVTNRLITGDAWPRREFLGCVCSLNIHSKSHNEFICAFSSCYKKMIKLKKCGHVLNGLSNKFGDCYERVQSLLWYGGKIGMSMSRLVGCFQGSRLQDLWALASLTRAVPVLVAQGIVPGGGGGVETPFV